MRLSWPILLLLASAGCDAAPTPEEIAQDEILELDALASVNEIASRRSDLNVGVWVDGDGCYNYQGETLDGGVYMELLLRGDGTPICLN